VKKLWYRQPAVKWEDCMPLGNGKLGAMANGSPDHGCIQLNEESLWSGTFKDRNNPDAYSHLNEIRSLLAEGKASQAEALACCALTGTPPNETAYQTLGELNLITSHSDYSDYQRSLDLEDACARVEYICGGVRYSRTLFVSQPDNVLVLRFTADKPGSVSFRASLSRSFWANYLSASESEDPDTVCMEGGTGILFRAVLKARTKGGTLRRVGSNLLVENADEAELFVSAATSFASADYRLLAQKAVEKAMAKSFEELFEAHRREYRSYFDRMELHLCYDSSLDLLPTDERLRRFRSGESDNGLVALYFDFGRYLLISSSRPGSLLPANLQGIWNRDLQPAWGSKFTININTEMNYWPAEVCGLGDCEQPLFFHIKRMAAHGRDTARIMYHCRGIVAHHNTDVWGDTAPQDVWVPSTFWVMAFPWLCTHIWEHYEYSLDTSFLRDYWPILQDTALFFIDYLVEDAEGRLVVSPTLSPENSYIHPKTGETANLCIGCTMDSQILRDFFRICIRASEILGTGEELASKLKELLPRLPKTEIHSNGTIREWLEEYEEVEVGHRHISHLYGLFPSEQITPQKTPELAAAAEKTLERRLSHGGGHTGWSRAWIINFWARLQNGEKAWENIRLLLEKSTLDSLLDNHPPFQIDGNFGGTAGIANMLLQCINGEIVLLPALPKEWPSGSVCGLRGKGGLSLNMRWEGGTLADLSIQSPTEQDIALRYGNTVTAVHLVAGINAIDTARLA
jgi:alpha-L-fucosidase 2